MQEKRFTGCVSSLLKKRKPRKPLFGAPLINPDKNTTDVTFSSGSPVSMEGTPRVSVTGNTGHKRKAQASGSTTYFHPLDGSGQ